MHFKFGQYYSNFPIISCIFALLYKFVLIRHALQVPIGTIVKTDSGTVIGDLEKQGQICIVARGGAGGKGNHFFLSNEERAPTKAEEGAQGQLLRLKIELRTMAHAGLVSPVACSNLFLKLYTYILWDPLIFLSIFTLS